MVGISGQLSLLQLLCPCAPIWFEPRGWHPEGLSDVADPRASGSVCTLETLGGGWGGGRVQHGPCHILPPAITAIPLHTNSSPGVGRWPASPILSELLRWYQPWEHLHAGGAARVSPSPDAAGPGHGQRRQALLRVAKAIPISGQRSGLRCQVWGSLATTERGSCWEAASFWMPRKSETILQCL